MPESPALPAACEPPRWRLSGLMATDEVSRARIDLAEPAMGVRVDDGGPGLKLLGLDVPEGCRPTEAWARRDDLTAIYEPGDDRRLRIAAMWRAGQADERFPDVRSWQLILSAQTSLLSSLAELSVESTGVGSVTTGVWREDHVDWQAATGPEATCLRICNEAEPASCLVLAIHPDDAGRIEHGGGDNGSALLRCRLFPTALEKGVLLRSRVLVALGPAASRNTQVDGWEQSVLRQFAGSEPILST